MERCLMCKGKAQIYCASDQASLCWACDAKVHSANFLAARHSMNLLCCVCQGPTPWSAAGAKLRPIPSACDQCVDGKKGDGDEEELPVVPSPPPAESCSSGGETMVLGKRSNKHESPIFTRRVRQWLQYAEEKRRCCEKSEGRSRAGLIHVLGNFDSIRKYYRGKMGSGRA